MSVKQIFAFFNSYGGLNTIEAAALAERCKHIHIGRGDFLLKEGDRCRYYYFIAEGGVRMFQQQKVGQEITLQFATENQWITDPISLYDETDSAYSIQAFEETSVLRIEKLDMLELFVDFPKFDRIFRVITERQLGTNQEHIPILSERSSEKRYNAFEERHPELIHRLNDGVIASYLQIDPREVLTYRRKIFLN